MAQVLILEFNYLNEDIIWCNRAQDLEDLSVWYQILTLPFSVALAGTLNFFEPWLPHQ